jgi:tetratricopeptide (TPR) repeat protein
VRAEEAHARANAQAVTDFLVDAFRSPDPNRDGRTITVAEVLDRAEKRLDDLAEQPLVRAAMLDAIGRSRIGLGFAPEGTSLLVRAQAIRRDELGPDHADTVASLEVLADAYASAGRWKEAVETKQTALEAQVRTLGEEHPTTLSTMHQLGHFQQNAGNSVEASRLFETSLNSRRKQLGAADPTVLEWTACLISAFHDAGRTSDAVPLIQALAAAKAENPDPQEDSPSPTAEGGQEAATAHAPNANTAVYESAIPLFEKHLAERRREVGDNSPHLIQPMGRLAVVYRLAGRADQALKLQEEELAIRRSDSPTSPDTLTQMHNVARSYNSAGRREEAIALFEEAVTGRREKLGPEHPDTLSSIDGLASAYRAAGRMNETVELQQEILEARRKKLGPNHPDTLRSLQDLSYNSAYRSAKPYEEASEFGDAVKVYLQHGVYGEAMRIAATHGEDLVRLVMDATPAQEIDKFPRPIDTLLFGELRVVSGDATAGESAIRTAIARGEQRHFVFKSLGWSLFAQGKTEAARQAFSQTLDSRRQENGTFRLDDLDPDSLVAAYFLDLISEQEFAQRLSDDERFACFPWFYIGQRREIEGQSDQAIAAYKRCVELGDDETAHSVRALARWKLTKFGESPAP